MYVYDVDQPPLDRQAEELNAAELEVHNFFSNAANIDKLISFLSLEERKGKDKFDARRFSMFKGKFSPRLVNDECLKKYTHH